MKEIQGDAEVSTVQAMIFDFDGVIVESTDIKSLAMAEIFEDEPGLVPAILDLNRQLGGISRLVKFEQIYADILRRDISDVEKEQLAEQFRTIVFDRVVNCPPTPGAIDFLRRHAGRRPLFLLSGTPDQELKEIVDARGLGDLFIEVYGSPPGKPETIRRIIAEHDLPPCRVVLVGDASMDREAALEAGVRFIGRLSDADFNPFPEDTIVIPDLTELDAALARLGLPMPDHASDA